MTKPEQDLSGGHESYMARTKAPDETPDDAGVTPGSGDSSILSRMEQSVTSSRYLGRVHPNALPPSSPAADSATPDGQPATAPVEPGRPPSGRTNPSGQLQAASGESARSPSGRTGPNGQPQATDAPALPGSTTGSSFSATEYWPTSTSTTARQQPISARLENTQPPLQDSGALSRQETPSRSGALLQRATDGQEAPPSASGKVSLPRPVSLTQMPASEVFRDEEETYEWETEEYIPSPSQVIMSSGHTQGATAPNADPEAPGFTILPPEPAPEAPFSVPWLVEDATAHSAAEDTVEVPKATGPLEAPPLVATTAGAATTFLPDVGEEAPLAAAVTKLQGACRELVDRIYKIRAMKNGLQIIGALVELVNDLDARYATDTSTTRQNGLEGLLVEVRRNVTEGDRLILESLENGRGGLTIAAFERDLKTIAKGDQPRILIAYASFLVFMITRELHRYLQPLAKDEWRMREVTARLDYLLDGVRETLVARLTNPQSGK
jgi:hypothetical protein